MNEEDNELCTSCHKEVSNSCKSIYCKSCENKYHTHCTKPRMTNHRGSTYYHACLVNTDIVKYNPFYELLTRNIDETEKTYIQNRSCYHEVDSLSTPSDVLENCSINSIESLNASILSQEKDRYMSMKFVNIDGNASNFDTLLTTLSALKKQFSIIGLVETNIDAALKDLYKMPGYNSVYQNKISGKKKGTGVALYIHDSLEFAVNKKISLLTEDIETLFVTMHNKESPITIGTVYRPPSGDVHKFEEIMNKISSSFKPKQKVIIMGDYNINLFSETKQRTIFEESTLCNGLIPTISVATHVKPNCRRSCIDNILVDNPVDVICSGFIDTHISHHRSLFLVLKHSSSNAHNQTNRINKVKYDFSKDNLFDLSKLLSNRLNECNKASLSFETIMNVLQTSMDDTCKLTTNKLSKRNRVNNPWITSGIINSISKRDRIYKKWKKTTTKLCLSGDPKLFEEYRTYRIKLSNLIKVSKQKYCTRKFENATGDYRQTWSLINEIRGKSKGSLPSHFTINGLKPADQKIIANKFNNHFRSLAENLNKSQSGNKRLSTCFSNYLPKPESSSIFFEDTTIDEVNETVATFSNEKSSDIPIVVVKHCLPILAPTLVKLYNKCMQIGSFPENLKNGRITPIHKKGPKDNIENYRPISTLPILGKIFEKSYASVCTISFAVKIFYRIHSLASEKITRQVTPFTIQ